MYKFFYSFWEETPIDLTLSQGESENKFVFELIDLSSDRKLKIKIQEKIDLTAEPNADTDVISVHSEEEQEEKEQEQEKNLQKKEIQNYLKKMWQGIQFPFHFFEEVEEKQVEKLPEDVDGLNKFKIKATIANFTDLVKDRCWFKMSKSTVAARNVIRRVGKCTGSYICPNPNCSYLSTEGERNRIKFNFTSGIRVCHSCGCCACSIECYARKLIEFHEEERFVYVYHIGDHSCSVKPDKHKYDEKIKEEIKKNSALPPKKLRMQLIKQKIGEGQFDKAKKVAEMFSDARRVKTIRQSILKKEDDFLEPNSMEAVAQIKRVSDSNDTMHIYKINSKHMNDQPDYIFKTSRIMMEMALKMDQNTTENSLQEELCFFDGAHSRVQGFVALAAWVLHPSMRQLFRLASMEVASESTRTVQLFWKIFNECIQIVKKEVEKAKEIDPTYQFNPKGFMCDESGANFQGMKEVFGAETVTHKIKTCQWHFLHQAAQKSKLTN